MAAVVQRRAGNLSAYRDQQFQGSLQEQEEKLRKSSTLYVGNLSFFTTEDQIYHLFSKSGDVKRVIMGLDRFNRTPCGFCFVEYYTRSDAEDAIRYVSGTRLDERIVRCDWDAGFVEGRQYGRGKSGGQVRDEFREDYDAGRGGFGKLIQHRVDKFGPVGYEGPPRGRFERGKRKWQDEDAAGEEGAGGDQQQGDDPDRNTDLRLKLQKIREDRAINGEETENIPLDGMEENTQPRQDGEEAEDRPASQPTAETGDASGLPVLAEQKANGDAEMESDNPDKDIAAMDGGVTELMDTES